MGQDRFQFCFNTPPCTCWVVVFVVVLVALQNRDGLATGFQRRQGKFVRFLSHGVVDRTTFPLIETFFIFDDILAKGVVVLSIRIRSSISIRIFFLGSIDIDIAIPIVVVVVIVLRILVERKLYHLTVLYQGW